MLKPCPNPVDVQDIQFKLRCRLKVFDNKDLETFSTPHSLISCASRYGLLFIGSNSHILQAVLLKSIENYSLKDKDISTYPRRTINLPSAAKHVSVNCDSTILAVVVEKDKCPTVIFYDVLSFYKQNITIIKELRLSATPAVTVSEVAWNPALPPIFTACKNDGTLGVYEIKGNSVDINELPAAAQTTSFCWSPKGKQIAVGSKNGKITQYKPDLKAVKVINEPPLQRPHSLISLQWVSNYQFVGIYQSEGADSQAKLIVVDAPKTGETSYVDYDDVCYSGSSTTPQFYMILQQHWNVLMVASSNSTEVGVLGTSAAPDTWTQWTVPDAARAELPLDADKQETLPVGMALDVSPTRPLPWGEGTIPPCPYLLVLSHHGVVCVFDVVYLKPGAANVCCPPDAVADAGGLALFGSGEVGGHQPPPASAPSATQPATPQTTAAPPPSSKPPPTFPSQPPAQPRPTTTPAGAANPLGGSTPLFGGQTTLTPIKPQPKHPLFGAQTSAQQKPPLFGGQTSAQQKPPLAFSVQNLIAPVAKPATVATPPTLAPPLTVATPPTVAPPTAAVGRPNVDARAVIDEKVRGETDAMLAKMVRDECLLLESEVRALLHQGRRVRIDVGGDEEKVAMLREMEGLREFIGEIVEISLGESAEVHSLKQNLILAWAWYEEAQSRYNISKDETMRLLLKSQPLDSATEKRQSDIKKLIYYMESQLSQTNRALDEQWDRFQDYAKKTYRVEMPTMEAIFQSMVKQNAVLQKQNYILKDLSSRLKHKKSIVNGQPLFLAAGNMKKLEDDLQRLQLVPEDTHRTIFEAAVGKTRNLTATKQGKLRTLLKSRSVHVVRPQLNVSSLCSPASRVKQTSSILGAQMSPVQKAPLARNLGFVQSTPIRGSKPDVKPTSVPPNTPALKEPLKVFTFQSSEPVSIAATSPSIVTLDTFTLSNLSQNASPSVPPAFIPTTQTNKIVNAPKTTDKPVAGTSSAPAFSFSVKNPAAGTNKSAVGSSKSQPAVGGKKSEPAQAETPTGADSTKSIFSFGGTSSGSMSAASGGSLFGSLPQMGTPLFGSSIAISFGSGAAAASSAPAVAKSAAGMGVGISTSLSAGKTSTSSKPSVPASAVPPVAQVVTSKPTIATSKTQITATVASTPISTALTLSSKQQAPASAVLDKDMPTSFFGLSAASIASMFNVDVADYPFMTTMTPIADSVSPSSIAYPLFVRTTVPFKTPATTSIATTTTGTSSLFGLASATTASATATTTSISMFKSTPATTSTAATTTAGTPPILFGSTPPTTPIATTGISSIFVATPAITSAATTPAGGFSLFGTSATTSNAAKTTGTTSIFASTPAITSTATTSAGGFSLFGTSATTSNAAKTTGTTSIFASTPTTTSSIFASTPTSTSTATTTTGTSSIFGSGLATTSTAATTVAPSIFGSSLAATSTAATTVAPSIFGSGIAATSTAATTVAPSIFGSGLAATSTAATTVAPSIFGSGIAATSTAATTVAPSIFGSGIAATSTAATTGTPPMFGSKSAATSAITTTGTSSIFGSGLAVTSTAATTVAPLIFGSGLAVTSTAATTVAPLIFGSSLAATSTATPTTASPFVGSTPGTISTAATTTLFGSTMFGASTTTTASGSIFGSGAPAATPTPLTTSPAAIFGGANSAFGATAPAPIFGGGTAAQGSIFGGAAAAAKPSMFGADSSQPAAFGGAAKAGSIFGGGATTTPSGFGTQFGQSGSMFGATSAFGAVSSSGGNIFGAQAATSGTASFGGLSVGGAAPSGSIFAQPPANPFAGQADKKAVFGGGGNIFGGSAFGAQPGPFSGAGAGVGQSGFSSPSAFQKPPAFGGAPAFGGSPPTAFGAGPSFGGAPAFGAAPAFGSPNKVFGSATPTAAFGSPAASSPGFGNLANQNTVGFGNLAQQASNTPASTSFSGNTSFSSWR